jgi:hypothetical protein
MPPRRTAASPEGDQKKRNARAEYLCLLTWLSNADNRNIITGAAGAAQNNGGMNSGKTVVSKSQGHVIPLSSFSATLTLDRWAMLARHLSSELSTQFDSSQAENKYRYYEGKYHKAKLQSQKSGFGVDAADQAKGIETIDQKMESLCGSYALWDSWFGSTQKFAPASVRSARAPSSDDDEEVSTAVGHVVHNVADEVHGGADGAADDEAAEAAARNGASSENVGDVNEPSQPPTSPVSPAQLPSAPNAVVAQGRGRGKAAAPAAAAASDAAVATATAAKNNLLKIVATSPSVAASNSKSSSSSFDQVYATVQGAKSAPMQSPCLTYSSLVYAAQAQLDIARSHNAHDVASQARGFSFDEQKQAREYEFQKQLADQKFAFEAEAKALEMAARRADQQADRNVRQRIEFEKNVTQLLEKDTTGALAANLMTIVDGRFGAVQRNEQQDPVLNLLERFVNKYSS